MNEISSNLELDEGSLLQDITLNVTIVQSKVAKWRLWLFTVVATLATWLGGFGGIEFEIKDIEDEIGKSLKGDGE